MDKPIIVDGVDVSECLFYKGYCRITALCDYPGHLCECTPNCYFKQLARKTQECEELKKQLDFMNGEYCANGCKKMQTQYKEYHNILMKEISQLKRKEQECEELKKDLHKNFEEKDKLHLIIDRLLEASGYDTNTASAEDFEDVYENMRYEKQQLDQLKQTLAEIKEIAENVIKNVSDRCIETTPIYGVYNQILQKISEVEDDRN